MCELNYLNPDLQDSRIFRMAELKDGRGNLEETPQQKPPTLC